MKTTWYRGLIRGKTRIGLAWVFAGILVLSARQYPNLPGILICFLGASLRYWASGFLRKDRNPAVGGPYRYTRNPLYLGTYLMAVGIAVGIGNLWLALFVSVVFAAIYHFIILDEETKLSSLFNEPYAKYCKLVPRFFPFFWSRPGKFARLTDLLEVNPNPEAWKFSGPLARENRAFEAYWSFMGLVSFVCVVAWVWSMFGSSS